MTHLTLAAPLTAACDLAQEMSNDEMDAHLGLHRDDGRRHRPEADDELPPGWSVEQRGSDTGRKYKVYVK